MGAKLELSSCFRVQLSTTSGIGQSTQMMAAGRWLNSNTYGKVLTMHVAKVLKGAISSSAALA